MDVINKLYSSVSQTVSQISSVLPGNPVTREYDVLKHTASAGRGCVWKIYNGIKKSTKEEASIFLLEKKQFELYAKDEKEEMFNIVRKGIVQLTKIRHPLVLTVQHPLEESRESFAFATEPVFASMANILGDSANIPNSVSSEMVDYNLHDAELKFGILQLFEGLNFIHNEAKLIHRNISPHSILLNKNGAFKLFGFDYSISCSDSKFDCDFYENRNKNFLSIPDFNFIAPECILNNKCTNRSDYYSLGMLICVIYLKTCNPYKSRNKDFNDFKSRAANLSTSKHPILKEVPPNVRGVVEPLLSFNPENRPDLRQVAKDPFFDDIGVKSLNYLDTLFQRDNQEKAKFYKGLQQIINKLPARMNINRILPYLTKEFVNPTMIPFVLPNVFSIAKLCSKAEFEKHIFVHLKSIMSLQEPVQILLIFMQNMELMLKLTSPDDVKLYVLPMMYKALESNSSQIQELCLEIIPSFAYLVDFQSMKNSLLPRIKHICNSNGPTSMRVNCLLCIGKLLPHLDKWVCLDEILLFLPTVASREPAVIMALVGIYKIAANHELLGIPKEFCVRKVLPFLWPLSIENGLTLQQYNTIMAFIKDLEKRVETEHIKKLQQLDTEDTSTSLPAAFDQRPVDVVPVNLTIKVANKDEKPGTNNRNGNSLASMKPQTSYNMPAITTKTPVYPSLQPSIKQTSPTTMDNMFGSWSTSDTSNQFQRPLLAPANSNFNTVGSGNTNYKHNNGSGSSSMLLTKDNNSNQFQRPLLAPVNGNFTTPGNSNTNFRNNNGSGSSTSILTKEDILEFLK